MRDNLKDKVLQGLEKCPETRDSDIKLLNWIWLNYYADCISKNEQGEYVVRLIDLYRLPREDAVKRWRAKFNEQGKYLPTDKEVLRKRRLNEENWRSSLGYSPELRKVYD